MLLRERGFGTVVTRCQCFPALGMYFQLGVTIHMYLIVCSSFNFFETLACFCPEDTRGSCMARGLKLGTLSGKVNRAPRKDLMGCKVLGMPRGSASIQSPATSCLCKQGESDQSFTASNTLYNLCVPLVFKQVEPNVSSLSRSNRSKQPTRTAIQKNLGNRLSRRHTVIQCNQCRLLHWSRPYRSTVPCLVDGTLESKMSPVLHACFVHVRS